LRTTPDSGEKDPTSQLIDGLPTADVVAARLDARAEPILTGVGLAVDDDPTVRVGLEGL
jgi:hypothetical protein